jgi:hypothetical protein
MSKFYSTDVHGQNYTYASPEILEASIRIKWDFFQFPALGTHIALQNSYKDITNLCCIIKFLISKVPGVLLPFLSTFSFVCTNLKVARKSQLISA